MKHIEYNHYDARDPLRSTFEGGLRHVFASCHDPLPPKMEELVHRLQKGETDGDSTH
jgi:hypothetical protein